MGVRADAPESPAPPSIEDRFVELWGDMSSLWGVNPTMARIHGLLFITGATMTMDQLMERLAISRGNVSMNVVKLIEWGLVQKVNIRGDRRDYFASVSDTWEMFTRIAAQRKRREIDPVLTTLRSCRDDLAREPGDPSRLQRIEDMLAFLTLMDHLATQFFASHKDLRAAVSLLAGASPTV
ncbi:MAG: MarR family transcriptional regulator [Gemmataceae bacterium]|nr:MarR family transcriptional regulator [Gemmataceae bacterium]